MRYFTSDYHFGHDKDFVYAPRGFHSMEEMCEDIIQKHNRIVKDEDDVYVLGDLVVGDLAYGYHCLERLKGRLHIVIGNHDTENKIKRYKELPNVVEVQNVIILKEKHRTFYLCHYPTMVNNSDDLKWPWCLHGHTHNSNAMQYPQLKCYNIAVDAHDCFPISIEEVKDHLDEYWNRRRKKH